MLKRTLGNTGEQLSIIGCGGIVVTDTEQSEADRTVREAFDRGINYFDVAPAYGNAEDRLGPALVGLRDQIFLACKTGERTKSGAARQLRQSLRKLKTDHFDLYQLHAMTTSEDLETAMGDGGAIEAFIEAREQGLVRYLGFSAHSVETALALIDRFDFDTILFPVNWVNYFQANFGPQVIEKAQAKGMGCLALKGMARAKRAAGDDRSDFPKCWYTPVMDKDEAALALRFTLSQPITAAIPPGDANLFRWAMDIAENFQPLTETELEEVKKRSEGLQPIFELAA